MLKTVETCSRIDCWLYKVYDVSACESIWLVLEDKVATREVVYKKELVLRWRAEE